MVGILLDPESISAEVIQPAAITLMRSFLYSSAGEGASKSIYVSGRKQTNIDMLNDLQDLLLHCTATVISSIIILFPYQITHSTIPYLDSTCGRPPRAIRPLSKKDPTSRDIRLRGLADWESGLLYSPPTYVDMRQ